MILKKNSSIGLGNKAFKEVPGYDSWSLVFLLISFSTKNTTETVFTKNKTLHKCGRKWNLAEKYIRASLWHRPKHGCKVWSLRFISITRVRTLVAMRSLQVAIVCCLLSVAACNLLDDVSVNHFILTVQYFFRSIYFLIFLEILLFSFTLIVNGLIEICKVVFWLAFDLMAFFYFYTWLIQVQNLFNKHISKQLRAVTAKISGSNNIKIYLIIFWKVSVWKGLNKTYTNE